MKLKDKVAVVIGASRRGGSGWCAAELLAAEGAKVFVAARRLDRVRTLTDAIGGVPLQCDISVDSEVAAMFSTIADQADHVDLAVCASGQGYTDTIAGTDPETLMQATAINYFGPFYFARRAFPLMKPGSSLIYYSTLTAKQVFIGSAPYSCAKAALNALTKYAALEFAPHGIRVNAIAPGLILSPQANKWAETGVMPAMLKEIPLGKGVDPRELAQMVLWLATEAKSMTGEIIYVDGGNHLRRAASPDEFPQEGIEAMNAKRKK